MTVLRKIQNWLKTYPQWTDELRVDYTNAMSGNAGVFPQGIQELSRRQDVVGNVTVTNRLSFTILRVTGGQQNKEEQAAWLIDFQNWVQQQSVSGNAPTFGDVPAKEKLWAEQGKLKSTSQTGTARYTVRLITEFTKIYKA